MSITSANNNSNVNGDRRPHFQWPYSKNSSNTNGIATGGNGGTGTAGTSGLGGRGGDGNVVSGLGLGKIGVTTVTGGKATGGRGGNGSAGAGGQGGEGDVAASNGGTSTNQSNTGAAGTNG